jgi:hypothetical protein
MKYQHTCHISPVDVRRENIGLIVLVGRMPTANFQQD